MNAEGTVRSLASKIGVEVGGPSPWDIQVHDPRFYARVVADGSLGLGESYMEGWWDCQDLGEFFRRLFLAGVEERDPGRWRLILMALMARMRNLQSLRRSPQVAQAHYDTTVAAYRNMSDKWITLSCGYWKDARNLDEAQEAKLDLVCRKIGLSNGDRILDIGCGFGSFARFAAERFGCSVTGINLSAEQIRVARELAGHLPVHIVQCDYRNTDQYWAIVLLTRSSRSACSSTWDTRTSAPTSRPLIAASRTVACSSCTLSGRTCRSTTTILVRQIPSRTACCRPSGRSVAPSKGSSSWRTGTTSASTTR